MPFPSRIAARTELPAIDLICSIELKRDRQSRLAEAAGQRDGLPVISNGQV
jgi:hypothetical protein